VFRSELDADSSLTDKQKKLLLAIPEEGAAAKTILAAVGVGRTVLKALVAKGLVSFGPAPSGAEPPGPDAAKPDAEARPTLSGEQESVVAALLATLQSREFAVRQLWGVTGSGKTEVYLRLISEVMGAGGGAIMLVPEIALTPQTIERVRSRFGDSVGVVHSGLPATERRREWARILGGQARVVVGARSAVFAPVTDLRLVVIDESHDGSYKQEEEPRYHARTIAQLRLRPRRGLLLEGSATPAVESMRDRSACLRLSKRATGEMPECTAIDMRG